jgi:hypothetical protein
MVSVLRVFDFSFGNEFRFCAVPLTELGAFEVVAGTSDEEEDDLDESSEAAVEVHPDQMSDTEEKESEDRDNERHKCVMCGKTFQHADNLRAHIQNHLGVKAQLNSCPAAKGKQAFSRILVWGELVLSNAGNLSGSSARRWSWTCTRCRTSSPSSSGGG